MRGLPLYNFQAFEDGARQLRNLGHQVVSPHDIDVEKGYVEVKYDKTWGSETPWSSKHFTYVETTDLFTIERALRGDFAAICTCDALSCLPGWQESEGTRKEIQVAHWIGLPLYEHDPYSNMFEEAQDIAWELVL